MWGALETGGGGTVFVIPSYPASKGGRRPAWSLSCHVPTSPACRRVPRPATRVSPSCLQAGDGGHGATSGPHLPGRAAFPSARGARSLSASRSHVPSGRSQPGRRGTPGQARGAEPHGGRGSASVGSQLQRYVSLWATRWGRRPDSGSCWLHAVRHPHPSPPPSDCRGGCWGGGGVSVTPPGCWQPNGAVCPPTP